MSFSLARGFSDGALTPTRAAAAGLFIAGVLIVAMWTYGSVSRWLARDPTTAPACYGGARNVHHTAGTKAAPGNPADRNEALWWSPRGNLYLDQVRAAEFACTAKSCDKQALSKYRSALFWYFAERLRRTRQLDANYGDKGLERARQLFGGMADRGVEQGLRDRYRAGVFRIIDFRENQDAIAIILLGGDQSLRPCRAGAKS